MMFTGRVVQDSAFNRYANEDDVVLLVVGENGGVPFLLFCSSLSCAR